MFPEYIEELETYIGSATSDLSKLRKSKDWVAEEQFQAITSKITELAEWKESKMKERNEKPTTSDPILTKGLVKAKMAGVKTLIKALNSLEKPKPEPNTTSEDNKAEGIDSHNEL